MTPGQARALLDGMTDADFPTVTLDEAGLTQTEVDDFVEAAHSVMGRPSLTAPGRRSPQITVRLPERVDNRLTAVAVETGRRRSAIVREAVDRYLFEPAPR
jgi:hypothetical protein